MIPGAVALSRRTSEDHVLIPCVLVVFEDELAGFATKDARSSRSYSRSDAGVAV